MARDISTRGKLSPLELSTPVLLRELGGGATLAYPLADPSAITLADEQSALLEQRMYLETLLSSAPPHVISAFAAPIAGELSEISVEVRREDLPERLQLREKLTFACLVLPHGKERWVVLPDLSHTFHVAAGEALEQVVGDEVRRMIGALAPTSAEWLALLPPLEQRLETLELSIDRGDRLVPGRARAVRKRIAEQKKKEEALAVLESVATPLHAKRDLLQGPPLCGRERELCSLATLLDGKERRSVMLLGPDLVGKSALFRGWLQARHGRLGEQANDSERVGGQARDGSRAAPEGERVLVFATSGAQLVAGMSGLGQWQERLRRVLEAAELLDAVLYLETLGDIFSDHPDGQVDIAGALRPWVEQGRVRLVSEARPEALDVYESRHAGFISALQRVTLEPLGPQDSVEVLQSRVRHAQRSEPQRPNLEPSAIEPLVDLVDRYHPYSSHPGKAVRFFEQLRASCEEPLATSEQRPRGRIGMTELYLAFSISSGIPTFLLRQDQGLAVEQVEAALRRRVVGQDDAVRRVAETVCVVKARLQPPGKPLATLLFAGPTGVGKTELARALAAYLFGSDERLTRFDMSEYMDADAAERLIRGTERSEGQLTRRLRQRPFCVLLLDEIEKAHPAVFDLLLQVLGEGRLTDAAGRIAHFNNAIIIMTSNLGASHRKAGVGLVAESDAVQRRALEQIERAFRPELINRLDRIIAFAPLSAPEIDDIAQLMLGQICARRGLSDKRIGLDVSAAALRLLGERGYSSDYGARQLRRCLERELVTPLAALISEQGKAAEASLITVSLQSEAPPKPSQRSGARVERSAGSLRLTLLRGRAEQRRSALRSMSDICDLRREIDELLQLERVQEVREQRTAIVTQLLALPEGGKKRKNDARRRHERKELQTEHYRLDELWQRIERPHADLLALEELALSALLERDEPAPYLAEASAAQARFLSALCYLLVGLRSRRDEATLLVQELDAGRALDLWLRPLVAELGRLRWKMTVHGQGVRPTADDDWEPGRWGPPRDVRWLLAELARGERPFRAVVLRVRGPYAGCLLPLEKGPHVYGGASERGKQVQMFVRHIASRAELTKSEWKDERLAPVSSAELPRLRREAAVRAYAQLDGSPESSTPRRAAGPCELLGGEVSLDVALEAYWRSFEEIATAHLLAYELSEARDIDGLFSAELPEESDESPEDSRQD